MELTLDQALHKGIEAHKAGKAQEADRYYTAILKANPKHPDANHNMGVLAVGVGKVEKAIPFFKAALEANPSIAQFWLSYIDALIKLDRIEEAKSVLDKAKSKGAKGDGFDKIGIWVASYNSQKLKVQEPPQHQLHDLINLCSQAHYQEAKTQAGRLLKQFPNSVNLNNILGAANQGLRQFEDALLAYKKAIFLKPDFAEAYNNTGNTLKIQGKIDEAIEAYEKALSIKSDYAEAYYNMGNALKDQGQLNEAVEAYKKALSIKPDYAEALSNMGNAFLESGQLDDALEAYKKATYIKPDYAEVFWNLSGTVANLIESKRWIEKCLIANPKHLKAKLTLSAIQFYEGNQNGFNSLMKSSAKENRYMRSFNWVFNLPKLPVLHFNRWALFDHMITLSKKNRPFYEFGVWRGEAFKYLIKTFEKGYGFDTFDGLPENWHEEKAGTYSSYGNIPKIDGGEFIVGKFEDTLPGFFAKKKPKASIINFDADLYSSTIFALNYSKPVIDKHTILIFDEFIMNEKWEEDEFKALEEFCKANNYTYEVLAISFFTKQVAVKLIGI